MLHYAYIRSESKDTAGGSAGTAVWKLWGALPQGDQLPPHSGETRPTNTPISDQASRGHSRSNKFSMPLSSSVCPHSSLLTDWYKTLVLLNSLSKPDKARFQLQSTFLERANSCWRLGLWLGVTLPQRVLLLQLVYNILVFK